MRKISLFLCAVLVVGMMLPLAASAECNQVFENAPVTLPKSAPTIDGVIKTDEGWSSASKLDEDTAGYFYGQNPLTSVTDLYFAYSDDGLYFAADLTEYGSAYAVRFYEIDENGYDTWKTTRNYIDKNADSYSNTDYPEKTPDGTVIEGAVEPPDYNNVTKRDPSQEHIKNAYWYASSGNGNVYSEGDDLVDKNYGWDGDVITLSLDPLGAFNAGKFWGDTEYVPQYNVGIFEGDVVKIKTSRVAGADITDVCKAAGKLTEEKITFEVFIPWDQIVKDMNEQSAAMGLGKTFTKEEMTAPGASHRASVTLMDRFFDPEAMYVDSWGRYAAVCSYCDDGSYGPAVGPPLKALGMKLNIASGDSASDNTDPANNNVPVTDEKGSVVTDANGKPVVSNTTKTAGTDGKNPAGGSSAQTGDAGIIIAVAFGIVAVVGIVIAFTGLKRKK